MRKREKVEKIIKILEDLYPDPQIPLFHKNSYTLLIAVLLSAQCTDARVNTITPKLFAKASTPQQMVQLTIAEIAQIIHPCGLSNNKSRAIWMLSQKLIEEYHGEVPNTFEELESLPGVGHKTASVVMAQGFQVAAFPIDTHIHRCAKRWGLSSGKNVKVTEADLKKIFPKNKWIKLHLQIIYFAREYCPARQHERQNCPICSLTIPNKFAS